MKSSKHNPYFLNSRSKLLVVTPTFPYPIDAGGRVAQFFMLEYLCDHFDITVLSLQLDNPYLDGFKKACPRVNVITIPKGIRSTLNKAKQKLEIEVSNFLEKNKSNHLFVEKPSTLNVCNNRVLHFLKSFDFSCYDLIQFDFVESAAYLSKLNIKVPTILVHHELRFVRCERELAIIENDDNQSRLAQQLKNIKEVEIEAIEKFDNVVVFSDVDKSKLESLNIKTKIFSSPFGSKLELANKEYPFRFQNKVVYLGGERHFPNKDAVCWFINQIWPSISSQNPKCKFLITGNWSNITKTKFEENKSIRFTGMVDSIAEVLEGSILVVPLRIGSGIRTKIFESFALKVPVLSTSIGAEGIPVIDGQHCFIEDEAAAFSNRLIQMMNMDLNQLVNSAQLLYNKAYTVQACGERRLSVFKEIHSKSSVFN